MNVGKSYICKQNVSHLKEISYSESNIDKIEILFILKSEETKEDLYRICFSKKIKFTHWKIIHDLDKVLNNALKGFQTIVIFEDMTTFINASDNKI